MKNSFKIGDVSIPNRVILAPMAGVSDMPFRLLVKEMGCGLVYSEMISAMALISAGSRMKQKIKVSSAERPIAMQLLGKEPGIMAEAAVILAEKSSPDIIDINCGCPVPKVIKNGEGAILTKHPWLTEKIVRSVKEAVNLPVTVKIRSGWNKEEETAVEVAQAAEGAGADAVAVHARTRDQLYRGKADWQIIKLVKDAVKIPVIGNGDVNSVESAISMMSVTGCDAVMIGRASRGNPWIFAQVAAALSGEQPMKDPGIEQRIYMATRHLQSLVAFKGEEIAVRQMRGHAAFYLKGVKKAALTRVQIYNAASAVEIEAILENVLYK